MFGHYKVKLPNKILQPLFRVSKKKAKEKPPSAEELKKQSESRVQKNLQESEEARHGAFERGKEQHKKFFSEDIEGLSPAQKISMQTEANKHARREAQSLNRRLVGDLSSRGIRSKGGIGEEQQRHLHRQAQEGEEQVRRDVNKLDTDISNQKRAAIYTGAQGEAAQNLIARQSAQDREEHEREMEHQRKNEKKYQGLMRRI